MRTKSFSKQLYDPEHTLVIYGASVYGEIARVLLESQGIRPDFFCDKSEKKTEYYSVPVIQPEKLYSLKNPDIIIASADFFYEIKEMLVKMNFCNLYDLSELLEMDIDPALLSNRAKEVYNSRQYYRNIVKSQDGHNIVINRIQYVVTEKCSLRCKDCSHLMPYYKKPVNVDLVKSRGAFERLLQNVDCIGELRILGGEPFLNPEMYRLIQWYSDRDNICEISIYTNGTILPDQKTCMAMQREKVKVHISDYVINHSRIETVTKELEKYHIRYFVRTYDEWQDTGGVQNRGYSDEELKKHFEVCFERNGFTFLHGRLYRCPRSAHGINLGAMPDSKENYIDLEGWDGSEEELQKQIRALQNLKYLESCRYCSGPDNHQKGIPAAIQTTKILEF